MARPDRFTLKRLQKFVEAFHHEKGNLPTLRDLEDSGFERSMVDSAVKSKLIQPLYVTLTTGAVVKGYKASS